MTLAGREISYFTDYSNKVYSAVCTKDPNKEIKTPNIPQNIKHSHFLRKIPKAK